MSTDSVELKDPESLTKNMGAEILSAMFGDKFQGELKSKGEAQPLGKKQEDIPNASIRLDKMKNQRDEERKLRSELEKRLAQMEGKLSVLEKPKGAEDEVDPTEYMDDTQRLLYNENQKLKDTISKLTEVVNGIQTEGTKKKLEEQENRFFDNNPKLKENRDQFVKDMLDYLENKPAIKKMLKSGDITLSEVYGMYEGSKPKSTKTTEISDPNLVFSGSSSSVPAGKTEEIDINQARSKASRILNDKESVNKKAAIDFYLKDIVGNITSQLDI